LGAQATGAQPQSPLPWHKQTVFSPQLVVGSCPAVQIVVQK
jgi:hypothetical protein